MKTSSQLTYVIPNHCSIAISYFQYFASVRCWHFRRCVYVSRRRLRTEGRGKKGGILMIE